MWYRIVYAVVFCGVIICAEKPSVAADPANSKLPDLKTAAAGIENGKLGFHYATRDGVQGNGESVQISYLKGENHSFYYGRWGGDEPMHEGPADVLVTLANGKVTRIAITIGQANSHQDVDWALGEVDAGSAARYLFDIASVSSRETAEEALLGAVIARGALVAEPLLNIVKNNNHSDGLRISAMSWLAFVAAEKAVSPIQGIIEANSEGIELRKNAVFALSQIDSPRTIDTLITIARDTKNPHLQRTAIMALAEHDSPKVLALFEEILLGND